METYSKKSIKNWSEDDRPREKLLKKGTESLSDSELVAILLGSGSSDKSAVELAREILDSCHSNINILGRKSCQDLMKFRGVGEAKAVSIIAAMELGRRRKSEEVSELKSIRTSKDIFMHMHPLLCDLNHEEFFVIYLNRANTIIDIIRTSKGGTVGTVIDVKMILKLGIERLAQSIVLVHNHPSENTRPSNEDKSITQKIKHAADLLEIKLLDHIIIGGNKYYSFADDDIL